MRPEKLAAGGISPSGRQPGVAGMQFDGRRCCGFLPNGSLAGVKRKWQLGLSLLQW